MYFNGGKSSFLVRIKRSSLGYSKKRYPFNTHEKSNFVIHESFCFSWITCWLLKDG